MKTKELNDYIIKALCNYDLPGLAISADIGDFSYTGVAGYKDMPTREALKPNHIFHMASVSKLFTGLSILKLVEYGKLGLDDDITKHLDFLPFKNVTIKKMLTHTAGIGDVEDYHWSEPEISTHALLDYVKSDESLSSQILTQGSFVYSNIAYEILGSLVSHLSGISYEDFVAENFLKPAGMNDSTMLTFTRTEAGREVDPDKATREDISHTLDLKLLRKENVATPHVKDKENNIIREDYFPYNREHGPSSTLTSNVRDMRKWAKYILSGNAMNSDTYDTMWKKHALVPNNGEHIGLSWFIREQEGYTLYGHEGTDDGFRASFWICPELDAQVTVVANITRAPVKKINKHVFDILIAE